MTERYPLFYRFIRALGIVFITLALVFPVWTQNIQLALGIGLIVVGGIPHGATDYLIFRHLSRPLLGTRTMSQFYLQYLILMLVYSVVWWLSPLVGLIIFLLLSMFHFGQSNWNYISWNSSIESILVNTAWGAFAVLTPVIWHFEAARPIITQIIGWLPPALSATWQTLLCLGLLLINGWCIVFYYWQGRLNGRQTRHELINLSLLAAVFYALPLLMGFAVYFVFWHSFSSMLDQFQFFKKRSSGYTWRRHLWNTLPFSLLAILGLAGMVWGQAQLGLNAGLGALFIFISIVTLPHMILIDRLYAEYDQVESERRAIDSQGKNFDLFISENFETFKHSE